MKIINRTDVVSALTNNSIKIEAGITPMLITNPVILVDWYHINRDYSSIIEGLNIPDGSMISSESVIMFDKITNLPVGGIDNLLMETTYDEENGWTTDYNSSGFVFANTVNVTENDYFVVHVPFNGGKKLIYKVTEHKRDYVKNMSIIQFEYSFAHDDLSKYYQLEKQVKGYYTCLSSQLGPESSLIIEETGLTTLKDRVISYLDLCDAYVDLFLSSGSGLMNFEIPASSGMVYVNDRILNRLLATHGIIYFDRIVQFGRTEFNLMAKTRMIEFDTAVSNHASNSSIISQIMNKKIVDDKCNQYPLFDHMPPHIAKYQANRMLYISQYHDEPSAMIMLLDYDSTAKPVDITVMNIFDDEFIAKLKTNTKYDNNQLRNLVIDIYNNVLIDYTTLELNIDKTADVFYLLPFVIKDYQNQIIKMIK